VARCRGDVKVIVACMGSCTRCAVLTPSSSYLRSYLQLVARRSDLQVDGSCRYDRYERRFAKYFISLLPLLPQEHAGALCGGWSHLCKHQAPYDVSRRNDAFCSYLRGEVRAHPEQHGDAGAAQSASERSAGIFHVTRLCRGESRCSAGSSAGIRSGGLPVPGWARCSAATRPQWCPGATWPHRRLP